MLLRNIISNLQVYASPDIYRHLLIAAYLLFAGYVFSFLILSPKRNVPVIIRTLVGNIVSINIIWVLLLTHNISRLAMGGVTFLAILAVIFLRVGAGRFFSELRSRFTTQSLFNTGTLFILLVFILFLPRTFNGMLRWDEMCTHLAYPQYWINNGGFEINYSQRYPVYSLGIHVLYSFLMVFGNAVTVKVFNGFLFLFFLFGIRQMISLFRMPWYFLLLFVMALLTMHHFNEVTFSAMLEPMTWTYTLYMVLGFVMVSGDLVTAIANKDYKPYYIPLLLTAVIVNFKNLFAVYLAIFMALIALRYLVTHFKDWKKLIPWILFSMAVIIVPSLINFAVSFYYSGDPLFPILTMNIPQLFPKMWDASDIWGLVDSVHHDNIDTLPEYLALIEIPMIITLVVLILALTAKAISYAKAKKFENIVLVLGWCFICIVLTHFLFPNPTFIRYAYFLITALFLAICIMYSTIGRIGTIVLVLLVVVFNFREMEKSIGYYGMRTEEHGQMNLRKITYGNSNTEQVLQYVIEQPSIDTVYINYMAQYRFLIENRGKVVIGDDIGKHAFSKLSLQTTLPRYVMTPNAFIDSFRNYTVIYQNPGYSVLIKE